MKNLYATLLLISSFLFTSTIYADKLFVMHGFKIGQKVEAAKNQFGKPFKSGKFEDGFSYTVYRFPEYVLVFEADNTRPDLIWGIQLEGNKNPEGLGLNGINLGDSEKDVISKFGSPSSTRQAIDEITKKPIENTKYLSYDNYSLEIANGKVSSIKINYNGVSQETTQPFQFAKFITTAKQGIPSELVPYISADFVYYFNGNKYGISKSILESLKSDKQINDIFFNPKYGITKLNDNDIQESAMRFQTDPNMVGHVYKIKKDNVEYDLVFSISYEGWVLKYISRK